MKHFSMTFIVSELKHRLCVIKRNVLHCSKYLKELKMFHANALIDRFLARLVIKDKNMFVLRLVW